MGNGKRGEGCTYSCGALSTDFAARSASIKSAREHDARNKPTEARSCRLVVGADFPGGELLRQRIPEDGMQCSAKQIWILPCSYEIPFLNHTKYCTVLLPNHSVQFHLWGGKPLRNAAKSSFLAEILQ